MFKNNLLWWDYSFTSDTQWWLLVQQYKLYLSFSGVSVWQSPPLCSELLSHLGQSLKVSPINDEERPTVIHTAIWTLPSTSELNLINLLAKKIPKRRQRSSKGCNVFMFFRQFYGDDWKRQTYLQNSLVYDSGNKTAATAFKLSLIKKEKKKHVWDQPAGDKISQSADFFLHFVCVWGKLFTCSMSRNVCVVGGR